MPSVATKIRDWGRRKGFTGDTSAMLKAAVKRKIRFSEIAQSAGCSQQALRYQLRKVGITSSRPKFEDRLKDLGYADTREFFTDKKNVYKSMKELSEMTGFCRPTISKYYHRFVKDAGLLQEKR